MSREASCSSDGCVTSWAVERLGHGDAPARAQLVEQAARASASVAAGRGRSARRVGRRQVGRLDARAAGRGRGRPRSSRVAVGLDRYADAREEEGAVLLQHLARDHEALDLVRALVDLRDLRVAHHALDRVLLDVPVAAEDLHGLGRHPHRGVGAEELRLRGRLRQLGAVDALRRPSRRTGRAARARPRTPSPCRRASRRSAGAPRSACPSSRAYFAYSSA